MMAPLVQANRKGVVQAKANEHPEDTGRVREIPPDAPGRPTEKPPLMQPLCWHWLRSSLQFCAAKVTIRWRVKKRPL